MLTSDEREFGLERALEHIANRYVVRQIMDAETDAEAIRRAKKLCRWFGVSGPNIPTVRGAENGVRVATKDGREGLITWRELAMTARRPTQLAMFGG